MRKILISVLIILAILVSITSCSKTEESVYRRLNGLSDRGYEKIKLNITALTGDIELTASYELTHERVIYSFEKLNLISDDSSSEYKTTVSGSADVEDGKIVKLDGEEVELLEYGELKGDFDFQEIYFEDVKDEEGYFSARVVSDDFFKNEKAENMSIIVNYKEDAFESITLAYDLENSSVRLIYTFEE